MSRCQTSCKPQGCRSCGDYGSRAERAPSLSDITVVDGLLTRAFLNLAERRNRAAAGELDAEALAAADAKLEDWLAATFSGANRHFESDPDFHPAGLAEHLAEGFGLTQTDAHAVLEEVAERFVAQCHELAQALERHGLDAAAQPAHPAVGEMTGAWAAAFCGAPLADDEP